MTTVTETPAAPSSNSPASKTAEPKADGNKTIQLVFASDEDKKLFDTIESDAKGDDRKNHIYLMRWLKKHYKSQQ